MRKALSRTGFLSHMHGECFNNILYSMTRMTLNKGQLLFSPGMSVE